jgi:NADPH-dependent glutamate synthase beta subunit-like oxidoreductase/Pyruvate/2-oxoacid:ferredoxin oxidoreductase delta subunit
MKSSKNRLHRVVVLGATPAGIAAANKLGELGIPVTLVDKDADLNVKLADDTYRLESGMPFNFAHRPGLIRLLRNPGVRCLLPATVTSAKHSQQGFAVKVNLHQTFVDPERCTLCGQCIALCPVSDDTGNKPIAFGSRWALPGRAVIDKRQEPSCQANCPLGVNVQGYIALAKAGRYVEALALIRKDNVLPGICGRVCHHPCESVCRRADVDAPLAIRDIKRFLADFGSLHPSADPSPAQPMRNEKVAVVGSGPAGLAAAADLARQGFRVTIFEKEGEAGGLLRYGIGPHRLPRKILDAELKAIEAMGVTLLTGHAVDLAVGLTDLKQEFASVILTVGSWSDRKLGVPGEALEGVEGGLVFLQKFYSGQITTLQENVAVIGDGNAAFDLARVLHRMGAHVTLLSWFPPTMIPADEEEVRAALAEGIHIIDSRQVTVFNGESGRLQSLTLMPTQPGEPDTKGIRWPVIEENGQPCELTIDRAFVAIGQAGAFNTTLGNLATTAHGYLAADKTGRTALQGVYAAGDAVSGASSVVQAMASGRTVAATVMRELMDPNDIIPCFACAARPADKAFVPIDPQLAVCMRAQVPETPVAARGSGFAEVVQGYNENQVRTEAGRCLQCASCSQCMECLKACTAIQAIRHSEPQQQVTESAGVMIIADPEMGGRIRGDDVLRAYGPKSAKSDLNAMLMRGFAAAAKAMVLLKETSIRPKGHGLSVMPPDPGLTDNVRMGVFACRCNNALGWIPEMDAHLKRLNQSSQIICAEAVPSACISEGITHILNTVRDRQLTRVVLASCVCCPLNFVCSACTDQRSRLKEALFSGTGLSRSMVQTINLRGEVLRHVAKNPDLALSHFAGMLARSIHHAAKLLPFPAPARTYNFTTAVIGQSEASVVTALNMADAGMEVVFFGTQKLPLQQPPIHPNIHLFTDANVHTIGGTLGNFRVTARDDDQKEWVFTVGSIVLGENSRKITLYRQHKDQPEYKVRATVQKSGINGSPFIYPGMTSISGLFLADPSGVQVSKRTKGAAAAVQAAAVMPRGARQSRGYCVAVKKEICRSCGRCLAACPYQAIAFQSNDAGGYYAEVDEALCKGCGNCISVCPSDAVDSPYRDQLYLEQTVESLLVGQCADRY